MSSQIRKVALAGATGSLGSPTLQALLDAGFEVTALTRASSTSTFPSGVKVAKVDYESPESLEQALQGQDALVSTLGSGTLSHQQRLVDAAVAASVKRVIPSEFGSDTEDPELRALPVFKDKTVLQDYTAEKTKGTATSYTFVQNGIFLDWCLERNLFFNVSDKTAELYDGGDLVVTATPLNFIGKATAAILKHLGETANRIVHLHGAGVTQKQLLALAQKHTSADGWTYTDASTKELVQEAYVELKNNPDNVYGWMIPMIKRAAIGKGVYNNFSQRNDNDVLGIKPLTEQELEEIVKASVQKALQQA